MSEFEQAYTVVLMHEGRYSNRGTDSGGETYRGVARNHHPGWLGWGFVDRWRPHPAFPAVLDDVAGLQLEVRAFYRAWWERYGYGRLESQDVATKVFDLGVNLGPKAAHVCMQRALRSVGWRVAEDGILGSITVNAVNQKHPCLLTGIRCEAAGYYRDLDLQQSQEYEAGWLSRAYS